MQQVLLGLAALAIAMTLALNSTAATRQSEEATDEMQVTLMAANVIGEALAEASLLPFDAIDDATTAAALTPAADFGGAGWDAAVDLDDLHSTTATRTRTVNGTAIPFVLVATVEYVEKVGTGYEARATPQPFKRVQITVAGPMGVAASARRTFAWHGLNAGA